MKRTETFAARIRRLRSDRGETLEDFARLTQYPVQTLNRYERGERVPKVDVAASIADALGVAPLWLIGYDVDSGVTTDGDQRPSAPTHLLPPLERQLLTTVRKMNPPGQQAVLDYAEYCVTKPEYQRPAETLSFAARAEGGLTGEKSLTPEGEAAWDEMQDEGSDPTP